MYDNPPPLGSPASQDGTLEAIGRSYLPVLLRDLTPLVLSHNISEQGAKLAASKWGRSMAYLTVHLHAANARIWQHENCVRKCSKKEDVHIYKTVIDEANLLRVKLIDELDTAIAIATRAKDGPPKDDEPDFPVRLTETPGQLLDRISILNLKLHEVAASKNDIGRSVTRLTTQLSYALNAYHEMFRQLQTGKAILPPQGQVKLYGDNLTTSVNPVPATPGAGVQ